MKKELPVQSYIEACLEICWYSTVNEPPLQYVFEADEQPDEFRIKHTGWQERGFYCLACDAFIHKWANFVQRSSTIYRLSLILEYIG